MILKNAVLALIGIGMCMGPMTTVFAQAGSSFDIGLEIINDDNDPPTDPTGVSASALSSTSIEVTWNASSDNLGVDGYEVFRDGNFVATTTGTSYTDTGLEPQTTYTYEIRAFDAALNFSNFSAPQNGSTLSDTPSESAGQGGAIPRSGEPRIITLAVVTESTSARIVFTTDQLTRATITWGLEDEYGEGIAREVGYTRDHATKITGLTPGTRYYFSIEIENSEADSYRLSGQSFVTKVAFDDVAPTAPSNFIAQGQKSAIYLLWQNPSDEDFAAVTLVRSKRFYPVDPFDGEIVYQGRAQSYVDRDVVPGTVYYYTLFAKDGDGNYSSGVIAAAVVPFPMDDTLGAPYKETPSIPKDPFENLPSAPSVPLSIERLLFLDFDFIQQSVILPQIGDQVVVRADETLTVSIDYGRLPEVLKTIGVTLTDPTDAEKVFTFLLRITKDKERYEATIAPLLRPGTYPISLTVLDYKNQKLKRVEGVLIVKGPYGLKDAKDQVKVLFFSMGERYFLASLLLLVLLLWLLVLWRRRHEAERKKTPMLPFDK